MRENGFRHLPVVDDKGFLLGVLSDRDIRNITYACESRPQTAADHMISPMNVSEVMSTQLVFTSPDTSVQEALEKMTDWNIGCMPVTEDGVVIGIVSAVDFLHLLRRLFGELNETAAP
jgi:acetoin utilization protein AcuB